jgi:lipoprotein NlpI
MASRVMSAEDALQKANSLFVDENFDEALKMYDTAIELDDSIGETFVKRSICNYKLDRFTST